MNPGSTLEEVCSGGRKPSTVRARRLAAFAARELTKLSYPELGRRMGGRDHSVILAANRDALRLMRLDADFAHEVACLMQALGSR